MGIIGFILSLVAAGFMILGLIPLLGWFNWITTLPLAIAGGVLSGLSLSKNRGGIAVVGLIISILVFFIAVSRLYIGCGII